MIERRKLPVDKLTIDVVQSREQAWTGDETDRKLAASVDTEGLLQDLLVRPVDTIEMAALETAESGGTDSAEYAVVAGSRRYHAAMEAGYERVPCKIIQADDLDAAWTSLLENTDRRELSEQEVATQLRVIYELVRPETEPAVCPDCGTAVDGENDLQAHIVESACTLPGSPTDGPPTPAADDRQSGAEKAHSGAGETAPAATVSPGAATEQMTHGSLMTGGGRFTTDDQALRYLAHRFLGRTDENALQIVKRHLRTAALPPLLQSLFKSPGDRTDQERTTLSNYGIDVRTHLGSGEGNSGTSREIVRLHKAVQSELDSDAVDPVDAVLETVGSLQFEEMSDHDLRRTLREFRHDVTSAVDTEAPATDQRKTFRNTLQSRAESLRETYKEVYPKRPFKNVDVVGPETQHHSRWHVKAMRHRDADQHGALVRELYQERLEQLAEEQGWA